MMRLTGKSRYISSLGDFFSLLFIIVFICMYIYSLFHSFPFSLLHHMIEHGEGLVRYVWKLDTSITFSFHPLISNFLVWTNLFTCPVMGSTPWEGKAYKLTFLESVQPTHAIIYSTPHSYCTAKQSPEKEDAELMYSGSTLIYLHY